MLKSKLTLIGAVTERKIYAYARKGGGYPYIIGGSQSSLDLDTYSRYSNLNYFQNPPLTELANTTAHLLGEIASLER